jgi:hypothetical protein
MENLKVKAKDLNIKFGFYRATASGDIAQQRYTLET